MISHLKSPVKGDPSDIQQAFPSFNLQLHCCRYWWLRQWEFRELSFPYWRIYHNNNDGAVLIHKGTEYCLCPNKLILIAPNTSYSTRMYDRKIPQSGFSLKGGRVNTELYQNKIISAKHILHLFIHFNLGMPYDNIAPGVYVFDVSQEMRKKIKIIEEHLFSKHQRFSFEALLAIQTLVCHLLSELPSGSWESISKDKRILEVMNYIDDNIEHDLSNNALASIAKLATNAFTRLFTEEMGMSPQRFVKKKRVDKACILLHHSHTSIDEVASHTGFADRYHFSRVFKQITSVSPALYRKDFGIK